MKPSNTTFRFKHFSVRHDHSSMRVGTNAVLIGAWCPLPKCEVQTDRGTNSEPFHVLDIGTGCGVIALMLAQRIAGLPVVGWCVDAIDIDAPSVEQAAANFAESPWQNRLHAYLSSAQAWQGRYDRIVSNPPFFQGGLSSPDDRRARARQADLSLNYDQLVAAACRMLQPDGLLSVIIPASEAAVFLHCATAHALRLVRRCDVHTVENRPASRVMIALQKTNLEQPLRVEHLTLASGTLPRSEAYQALTADFYL